MAHYDRKDALYQKAKKEGYRSRAAYKLIELNDKHSFLRRGSVVLDLGCFPGGWLQVALNKVGTSGKVVGIDLRELEGFPKDMDNLEIILGDLYEESVQSQVRELIDGRANLVLSDMSPQLTGIKFQDAARSSALVELAFYYAEQFLVPGGSFVAKIFPGTECEELAKVFRPAFRSFSRSVLKSSRKTSKEVYFVGTGFRGLARNTEDQTESV